MPMTETERARLPESGQMRNHWWWRPGWRPDRPFYTWHLTFNDQTIQEGDAAFRRIVHDYQAHLDLPGLDMVPTEWLHLTLQGVGFVDEVSEQDITQIVGAARARCAQLSPVTVVLGPARISGEAVGLYVRPTEPVRQVRAALRAAIADAWGSDRVPEPEDPFTPHVTLAYSNADGSAAPFAAVLATFPPASATVTIRAAQLIMLARDEHVYRWATRATVPLDSAKATQ
jgi:2'-5' RNA ligase